MRIRMRTAVMLATAGLLTAACGGGSDTPEKASTPNSGGDSGQTISTDISAELTYWDTSNADTEVPVFKQLVAKFNETYPNVKIDYQVVPFEDAQNKFLAAAQAGKGMPDVLRSEVAWTSQFAARGYLLDLSDSPLADDMSDYLDTPMSSNMYKGKMYGVPQVTDTLALYYNKKLFAKAGIDKPPTSWDEVESDAKLLKTKAGVDGIALNPQGYFLLPFIYGAGGDMVDTDSKTIELTSNADVQGISTAAQLIKDGAAPKPPATDGYAAAMDAFLGNQVGMVLNGPWEIGNISGNAKFGGIDNLGIAPVPAGTDQAGAPVGGHNYVITSAVTDPDKQLAAAAFISFMNSTTSQAFLADKLGLLPTRRSAYDEPAVKDNAVISAFEPALEIAHPRPWIPEGGQFFAPLDTMAVSVLVQGTDPAVALKTAAQTYKDEIVPSYSLGD
ncbi:MAG: extracellular solute-binding protein [Nocardioidaceae bacterium]